MIEVRAPGPLRLGGGVTATMRNVSRYGRRVGLGLSWTVAASRLLLATAAVAAARPEAPEPVAVAEPDPPVVVPAAPPPPRAPAADPPPPPATVDPWRSDLHSTTWMLVGATLVLAAITVMLVVRG
jgi:hypothetical protein